MRQPTRSRALREWFAETSCGTWLAHAAFRLFGKTVLSKRNRKLVQFDLVRLTARRRQGRNVQPRCRQLHLGCDSRRVDGWVNADVAGAEQDVDIACGFLPWVDDAFDVVVAQQVIEHIELIDELIPLLRELRRCVRLGGEIWLACPDMARVCRSYLEHRGTDLVADRVARKCSVVLPTGCPPQQVVNWLFHQGGGHKNLYDLDILQWACREAGLTTSERTTEDVMLQRLAGFPRRGDDYVSIYVRVVVSK